MIGFVKNKILSKKWMVISLLIGNILLISIAACSPMYSEAALQKLLNKEMVNLLESSGRYPGLVTVNSRFDEKVESRSYESVEKNSEQIEELIQSCGLPVAQRVMIYYRDSVSAMHQVMQGIKGEVKVRIEAMSELESHINVVSGTVPKIRNGENILEAVVSEKTLKECNLFVGEVLTLEKILNKKTGEPYQLVIVGVFEPAEQEDIYWVANPNRVGYYTYVNYEDFKSKFVEEETTRISFNKTDHIMLDYQQMKGTQVQTLLDIFDEFEGRFSKDSMDVIMYNRLKAYLRSANRLNITLWVLQIPIYMMLAVFIFTVSGQLLSMEQNEISVVKSRGASRKQILMIYLLQSTLLAVISLGTAIPLSYVICQMIGSANSFLEFVSRKALPARFSWKVWEFGAGAAIVSILTMTIPAIRYSKVGIVDHKRNQLQQKKPLWQILFLDVILVLISLYGLESYNNQLLALAKSMRNGAALDPLLYSCSAMFIVGAALFVVRIFPFIIKVVFVLFKRFWSPAMYASFLRMIRSRTNQNFIMMFLMLTLALGIFSAETAYTININAENQLRYKNGADIVLVENWASVSDYKSGDVSVTEPDFSKYSAIYEDATITRVMKRYNVAIQGADVKASLMGIHTKEFGSVATMKDDILAEHWYHYLNSMSQKAEGLLVSTSFRDELGYELGDAIRYNQDGMEMITGYICGFVDFWPSLTPPFAGDNGVSYFIIANLSHLQTQWGDLPYEIWIKNKGTESQYIYKLIEDQKIELDKFIDTEADLVDLKNTPELQATNGILTVGFIAILILCSVGFLIYWILSIQSRALQFGIFRAMGMSMKEVLGMLLNEQFFISGAAIVGGIGIGKMASALFVPMIQMVYSSGNQLLPTEIQSAEGDTLKMYLVVGVVMLICFVILGWMIKKIKIAEALKLGED